MSALQMRQFGRKQQRGLSILSTLIVGGFIGAALILGLKLVPVYTEFFAVKKAFDKVVRDIDPQSPATAFRNAFQKYAQIDDISSVDPQTIVVTKDSGKASMSADYQRTVPLFANVSLIFDFSVASSK
ncbi:DUF4845 domain-containing protein [Uliginosibacterium sp. H3]|uniref:DUF4845 domain-containing protein n=1 Tax=Uliginosibacterium silvisoli TaxID=3114758 RepID=A0ABU6K9P6_9RHOO|nr:DUF4845 domain-containing protein [Uliginosibacterium sp. H3]